MDHILAKLLSIAFVCVLIAVVFIGGIQPSVTTKGSEVDGYINSTQVGNR